MPLFKDDRALLIQFRAGERAALERVYAHYVRPLAGMLRRGFGFRSKETTHYFSGIRSAFELDNVLQEVFARAFSEAARVRYDGLRPYINYLFAIAKNYLIDETRRSASRISDLTSIDDIGDVANANTEDPSTSTENREIVGLLESFVATRPERDRHVYTLRYSEQMSQTDAAQRLGMTRVQLRRIEATMLTALLDHLRAHGYLTHHAAHIPVLIRGASCWILIAPISLIASWGSP